MKAFKIYSVITGFLIVSFFNIKIKEYLNNYYNL
jgi:hypothetical protein